MTIELTQQQQHELEQPTNQPAVPAGGRKRGRQLKYNYPLFTTTRLSKHNMDKLRSYGRYGDSIDDCVTKVLTLLETRGYETPKDQRSF